MKWKKGNQPARIAKRVVVALVFMIDSSQHNATYVHVTANEYKAT